jgi:ATP-binding cassette subfamily F protein 3
MRRHAGYLKTREVPMVIVSHDRMFLDQLCTKIVETELGVTNTYPGNYTQCDSHHSHKLTPMSAYHPTFARSRSDLLM